MMQDENEMSMNERERHISGLIREVQMNSILPFRLLDVAHMMEDSLPDGFSSDEIQFDRSMGVEWLNKVFQRHVNSLESDLLENGQNTFVSPPRPFSSLSSQWKIGSRKEWILEIVQQAGGAHSRRAHATIVSCDSGERQDT